MSLGLVVRALAPRARRRNAGTATRAGVETVERCAAPAERADAELPAPLSEAEGRRLMEPLTRVHERKVSRPRRR